MNMIDIRRRMLEAAASGVSFAYTGTYDSYGDALQGYLVLKTSGTLSIKGKVDLCLVGGGGKGYKGTSSYGGGGGAGGFVSNYTEQGLHGDFTVTIGAGSSTETTAGGQTSVGVLTANGGNSPTGRVGAIGRGTGGNGVSSLYDPSNGEDGVYPWDDNTNFSGYRVSGCGGGGSDSAHALGAGGSGGGGDGGQSSPYTGSPGIANTGGGGGGGRYGEYNYVGGNGGSGVVIICWGYNHS